MPPVLVKVKRHNVTLETAIPSFSDSFYCDNPLALSEVLILFIIYPLISKNIVR